ncbi:mandelate racemase/muconate lactonizing enzyme family protein [Limobrevibacterium gyesilva]|uniref:Mandelate racemase/muconate lactonizing enzyme family protein n=1 Tax=Limobrevibacterium gyesilva TaxID=2991712 RepID=A0AA41YWL4_9PROT|nr:mandelate racemase/muconate lactonizing enzyme family protein [Limobrevibacterium gyesilva]MCW3476697.1 mandelate racemase/muconate lactonizing enzyme family protein [Limobrevibacterium gyesilva]
MQIVAVETFAFRRLMDGRHFNPSTRWHERRAPLVRITTRDGLRGLGEGWCEQEAIEAFHAQIRQAAPLLLGADARETDDIWQSLRALPADPPWAGAAAAAAVDMALWDLRAQREEAPLFRLLCANQGRGNHARASYVPVYASGGLYADGKTEEHLAAEMRGYAERGFTAMKMKIGALSLEADMARVAAVRNALGDDATIIVDALGRLDRDCAPAWARRLAALGVRHIQTPLPATDVEGLAALNQAGPLRVIAGEAAFRPTVFQALAGAVDWLQFNPGLTGIAGALCLPQGPHLSPQCHATAVLQAACLHIGAGCGAVACEFHMFHNHMHDILPAPMRQVTGGCIALDDRPGLGIDAELLDSQPGISRVWSASV